MLFLSYLVSGESIQSDVVDAVEQGLLNQGVVLLQALDQCLDLLAF